MGQLVQLLLQREAGIVSTEDLNHNAVIWELCRPVNVQEFIYVIGEVSTVLSHLVSFNCVSHLRLVSYTECFTKN